ncbi:cobalamin biosynthesis protein CbiG [Methanobrevibacter curvatus]|uniref:Cobalamin biosynthesis protein CbiG n=1 Tax=Methanobrevibacter curvatus TaxID=49547 RepID=A0A166CLN0_9EURY|nr:cobalamin biosynthesis protein CbiG [Methanobrevibacter curvatus]
MLLFYFFMLLFGDNVKIAILSVSERGHELSKNLKTLLSSDFKILKVDLYFKDIKNIMAKVFSSYDIIVGVMATGILIRSIAQYIENKTIDPGVIAIDEKGKFVTSLLSGHIGRANEFTIQIADLINGTAVISTATDITNHLGIDVFANIFYFEILNPKNILRFNKAILEDKEIKIISNFDISYIHKYFNKLNENKPSNEKYKNNFTLETHPSDKFDKKISECEFKEAINFKGDKKIIAILKDHDHDEYINFNLKKIVFGIGSKKNIENSKVISAIQAVSNDLNIDLSRIDLLATADIKKDEKGIIESSEILNVPLNIISIEKIQNFDFKDLSKSEFVKENFNVYGICEPVSLISAGENSKLIYRKASFNGVTIAVAISK